SDFKEKVILAKINRAKFDREVFPGQTVRFEAVLDRVDAAGAAAMGRIRILDHRSGEWDEVGEIELMFSHIDQNMSGIEFPKENFVFNDLFQLVLEDAGMLDAPIRPHAAV